VGARWSRPIVATSAACINLPPISLFTPAPLTVHFNTFTSDKPKMPIRKTEKKSQEPPDSRTDRTGEYSLNFTLPQAYKPVQAPAPTPAPYAIAGLPASSTRDLSYFFNLAGSLYRETVGNERHASASAAPDAPPSYNDDFQDTSVDFSAVLVIWLFRQTLTHIFPIAERFHMGPADRQPLYSLTAQPSIRFSQEFNELAIKRRDPINGVSYL
jgi:hypothetical protein